jgi:DNA-binding response OmpR family regulator
MMKLVMRDGGALALINVLIVEDNIALRHLYELTLLSWGLPLRVESVGDGVSALQHLGRDIPDVLITDVDLPGVDGMSIVRELNNLAMTEVEEIIVISGLDEVGGIGGYLMPGKVTYFSKPAPFDQIRERIEAILMKRGQGKDEADGE